MARILGSEVAWRGVARRDAVRRGVARHDVPSLLAMTAHFICSSLSNGGPVGVAAGVALALVAPGVAPVPPGVRTPLAGPGDMARFWPLPCRLPGALREPDETDGLRPGLLAGVAPTADCGTEPPNPGDIWPWYAGCPGCVSGVVRGDRL